MSRISENIKYLRKQNHLTQEQMSEKIGIKRSLLGAYEEGRADPRLKNLNRISEVFGVPVDMIINQDLTGLSLNEIQKKVKTQGFKVLTVTLNNEARENIELVPLKASAGYLNGYADPEYLEYLPKFQIPILPQDGTYRAFEINGDSMLPVLPGTIVIGKYVNSHPDIKNGKTYILLTRDEGIVYKRIYVNNNESTVTLMSDNPVYKTYKIGFDSVLEIWEATLFMSREFPDPGRSEPKEQIDLVQLKSMVLNLQQTVENLRKN